MRFARSIGAVFCGALLAMGFAPFAQTWVMWAVFPVFFAVLWSGGEKKRGRKGFWLGYLMGLTFWLINLKWLATVAGFGLFAVSAFLALYPAFFGWFAATSGNPWRVEKSFAVGVGQRLREAGRSVGFAAAGGFLWCGLEWIRGWLLTGFGWNGVGVLFHDWLPMAQVAEWVGVAGLAFVPVFFGAVIAQAVRRLVAEAGRKPRLLHWDFACGMVLVAGCFFAGSWRLAGLKNLEIKELRVLLVQQNIPQFANHVAWPKDRVHRGYEELTLQALEEIRTAGLEDFDEQKPDAEGEVTTFLAQPDWIVWPEAALLEWLVVTAEGERGLGQLSNLVVDSVLEESGATLILGANEMSGFAKEDFLVADEEPQVWNSLLAFAPGGPTQSYHKIHLVPFGEVMPDWGPLKWIYETAAGVEFPGSFSAGTSLDPMMMNVRGEEIGVIPTICFEDTVGSLVRKFSRPGPQVILNITNDGWFLEAKRPGSILTTPSSGPSSCGGR